MCLPHQIDDGMDSTPAVQDTSGWHEVEQTLTALELPPVPPTSDPQRLLGYVLNILPRYTEMEMLATHLRLYASTLEQDMEQVKSHMRLLTREAVGEREKKQFLERYAAQVVKERNDLLHSRGPSKKKTTGSSHFVWHNCCKKNTSHAMDLAPSIVAFRGEKLQEATKKIETLKEEVRNQELLRKELDFLLKKTQREHDSKVAADRKHIQQLEKQILQRATLHSSLERKLYEMESALARHDKTKYEELSVLSKRIREAHAQIATLEKENASFHEQVSSLSSDRDRLSELLKETTESKDVFAEQIDDLSEKCQSLESEAEALRAEIAMLQTKDINDIRSQYMARIDRLQKDSVDSEQKLRREVDSLKQELKKRNQSLAQTLNVRQSTARGSSGAPLSGRSSGLASSFVPADDAQWSDGIFDDDRDFASAALDSSLSRSQLSVSNGSFYSSASAEESHFNLSKEVGADGKIAPTTSYKEFFSQRQSFTGSSVGGDTRELDVVSRALSTSSRELEENDDNTTAENEPFDWETFIDSASEISTLHCERTKQFPSAVPTSLELSTSTIHHEDSMARLSDPGFAESGRVSANDIEEKGNDEVRTFRSRQEKEEKSFSESRSLEELGLAEYEEEKESDENGTLNRNEQAQHDGHAAVNDYGAEQIQTTEPDENTTPAGAAQNELARDLFEMLNGLEQKRKKEEQKASQAEQALLEFQQLQLHAVKPLKTSPDS